MAEFDYHVEARAIAELIANDGLTEPSDQIREAIDYGVSGTEILMIIRHVLIQVCDSRKIDGDLRARIDDMILKIDDALGP